MAKKTKKTPENGGLTQATIDRFTNDMFGDMDTTQLPGFKWISEPPQPVKKTKKTTKKK